MGHRLQLGQGQVAGDAAPRLDPRLLRLHHRIDADEFDAAQQEGDHRGLQLRRGRQAAGRDHAAVFHLRQGAGERHAADRIHHPCPGLAFQGLAQNLRHLRPVDDAARPQAFQVGVFLGLAGQRRDLVAEAGENRHRHRADAAGGPGDQDRALGGGDAAVFQRHHAEHRGQPGGAHRHRLTRRQLRWHRHQPVGGDPRHLGVSAPMQFAHPPAGENHRVAGVVKGRGGGHHGSREVHPRHMRIGLDQIAQALRHQAVLVVEGGGGDLHQNLARRQIGDGESLHRTGNPLGGLVDDEGLERIGHDDFSFASPNGLYLGFPKPPRQGRVSRHRGVGRLFVLILRPASGISR